MNAARISQIGQQLIELSKQAETEKGKRSYELFRRPIIALFDEAIGLGALDGPQHGYLKGYIGSLHRNEHGSWEFDYLTELSYRLSGCPQGEPANKFWDPVFTADLLGRFLLSVAPTAESPKSSPIKQQTDERDDYKSPKWFEKHTTVSGESLRKAVSQDKFLRMVGPPKRRRYSLTDAMTIWGNDIIVTPDL